MLHQLAGLELGADAHDDIILYSPTRPARGSQLSSGTSEIFLKHCRTSAAPCQCHEAGMHVHHTAVVLSPVLRDCIYTFAFPGRKMHLQLLT